MKIWILSAVVITVGCAGPATETARPDYEAEALAVHAESLRAHRDGNWQWFGEAMTEPTWNVSKGAVKTSTREQTLERFRNYLPHARFDRYEDIGEPIVRVSKDGTLAWVIATVRIEGQMKSGPEAGASLNSTWAWILLLERQGDRWMRVGTVSTRVPD